jgi:3',5'-cyclic AMP phosphodiesterase CpdA
MTADGRTLLAQITDLHVGVGPGDGEPARRLTAVVAALTACDPAPDAVVATGDLVRKGRPAEYERVRELLAPLAMPVHVLPGNHDDREALRAALLPDKTGGRSGFVQYVTAVGGLRLVVCDTTVPGQDGGRLCAERMGWIAAALADDRETPTLLAMHHPPLLTGIRGMDAIGLDSPTRAELDDILGRAPNVHRVLAGHVHRAMLGVCGGCPVFTCPSCDVAIALDLSDTLELSVLDEPPALALHLFADGGLTTHVQPVA